MSQIEKNINQTPETGENPNQKIVIASVMTVMFLAAIDNMITSTILPSVISTIGGLSLYPWVASIFMLTSTITTPIYGKLSDIYGHKRFTIIAIIIFLIGSVLCGMAQTMMQLIIFRAIQGMGAGGLVTMSFIMFSLLFPKEKRASMQALLTAMWAVASIIGPVLGAFFVAALNWRWAFYINLPFGLISGLLIAKFFNIPYDKKINHSVDYKGLVLFAVGTLGLLYSLLRIGQAMIGVQEISLLIGSIVMLGYLVQYELKVAEPILPVKQFKNKVFSVSVFLNFISGACLFSTINFIPLFIQGVLSGDAKSVGQVLTAMSFGWVTGSTICGRTLNKVSLRLLIGLGTLLMSTGLGGFYLIGEAAKLWQIGVCEFLSGMGMGIIATGTLVSSQFTSAVHEIGATTSGVQLFRSIGGTMGISILGGIQVGYLKNHLAQLSAEKPSPALDLIAKEPHRILDPLSRNDLPPDLMTSLSGFLSSSIHEVFMIAFFISIISIFLSLRLPNTNLIALNKKD